ncbi:MAG TPA: hypothetical protein VFV87_01585 [Pirellulaceae bacterium]|nr:hypothetical protein [Pirellulaceae bacterium]
MELEGEQIRLLLGGGTGKSVLHFNGKSYPFTVKAGSAGGVGATKVTATGNVYFLKQLDDFAGMYTAVTAGAAAVKGAGRSQVQNDQGVFIDVRSKSEGVGLSLGLAAISISFAK